MTRAPRPTVDQVIAELQRLEVTDRELKARSFSRFTHEMRLWCDGARHALAWAAAYRKARDGGPGETFQAPTVALELISLALEPRNPLRSAVAKRLPVVAQDVGAKPRRARRERKRSRSLSKPGGV